MRRYLSAAETVENVVFNFVPIPCTAARITIETKPAMTAYSIAVAAVSSFKNPMIRRMSGTQ
jgi:hypothetical protein